jgi:hypothetical protein
VLSEKVVKKSRPRSATWSFVELKTVAGQNNVGEFTIRGITYDMGIFSSMVAYASRDYLNELLVLGPNEYQLFGIMLDDLSTAETAKKRPHCRVERACAGFRTTGGTDKCYGRRGGDAVRYANLKKLANKESWTGTKYRLFTDK